MSSKRSYDAQIRSSKDSDENQDQEIKPSKKSYSSDKKHHRSKITAEKLSYTREKDHRRKDSDTDLMEFSKKYHYKHVERKNESGKSSNLYENEQSYQKGNSSENEEINNKNKEKRSYSDNKRSSNIEKKSSGVPDKKNVYSEKDPKSYNMKEISHERQHSSEDENDDYRSKTTKRKLHSVISASKNFDKDNKSKEIEKSFENNQSVVYSDEVSSDGNEKHAHKDKRRKYDKTNESSLEKGDYFSKRRHDFGDDRHGNDDIVEKRSKKDHDRYRDKTSEYDRNKKNSDEDMDYSDRYREKTKNSEKHSRNDFRDREDRDAFAGGEQNKISEVVRDEPQSKHKNDFDDNRRRNDDIVEKRSKRDHDRYRDKTSEYEGNKKNSDEDMDYSDRYREKTKNSERHSKNDFRDREDRDAAAGGEHNKTSEVRDEPQSKHKNDFDDNRRRNDDIVEKRSKRDHDRYRDKTSEYEGNKKNSDEDMDYSDRYREKTKNSERHSKNDFRDREDRDAAAGGEHNKTSEVGRDEPQSKRVQIQTVNLKTGGAYIPPARLKMMQEQIKDKGSLEFQRIAWEALKKSIVGMTNKVNISNISEIVVELFKENIIRGRGVLARAVMQAQAASPTFTRVYASLVGIINTKFPSIGELIVKRLILQYRRGFRRNDKVSCLSACRFIAHLFNQEVVHEILILEVVTHLLETPTEDSVEASIALLKECGAKLTQLTKAGMQAITSRLRAVHHEAKLEDRVRYMMDVFFAVVKSNFKDFESIVPELDLVEEGDKYTHLINLDDDVDGQEILNVFKFDPEYEETEEKYKSVVKEILGEESGSEDDEDNSDEDEEGGEGGEKKGEEGQQILDMTETNIVCLRRKIYLTIQSSLDFEECAHKLLRLELKPGQIVEMCYMILDCCAQQRTYEKFFGLLAQRFCQINKVYAEPFTEIFENSYKTIHRLETNKLRNVANFFAHLLFTDAISWMVLSNIRLNEEDTTSSSRVFIKILFQELCEYMGLPKLNARIQDVTFQEAFDGLFPRDHPHNTRFAINFFTSIGLGGLTDELREHLKNAPKKQPVPEVNLDQPNESPDPESESDSESEKRKKKAKKHKKRKK